MRSRWLCNACRRCDIVREVCVMSTRHTQRRSAVCSNKQLFAYCSDWVWLQRAIKQAIAVLTQWSLFICCYVCVMMQGEHIPVATTRPETILGDTAVCVHPEDERYNHLIGKVCIVLMFITSALVHHGVRWSAFCSTDRRIEQCQWHTYACWSSPRCFSAVVRLLIAS
jgi:hypothetical protein